MKRPDFETGVTLVSLSLMPFAAWWIFSLESQLSRIPACEAARADTVREIYALQKRIDLARTESAHFQEDIRLYIEGCLARSRVPVRLEQVGIQIRKSLVRRGSQTIGEDTEAGVGFAKDARVLPRHSLNEFFFLIESGAPNCKLRGLSIKNPAVQGLRRDQAPPATWQDDWIVDSLVFASRAGRVRR